MSAADELPAGLRLADASSASAFDASLPRVSPRKQGVRCAVLHVQSSYTQCLYSVFEISQVIIFEMNCAVELN